MATKFTPSEGRSKVAQACLHFGRILLRARQSSVTGQDAQEAVNELFEWFSKNDAFNAANVGIAMDAVGFGEELLEARKTSTLREAIEAIQELYLSLIEK